MATRQTKASTVDAHAAEAEQKRPSRIVDTSGIETIFGTLYANSWLEAGVLKAEAGKRIARAIARLDKEKQKSIEDDAEYRLERWALYASAKPDIRAETLRLARERGITLEAAYELASKRR